MQCPCLSDTLWGPFLRDCSQIQVLHWGRRLCTRVSNDEDDEDRPPPLFHHLQLLFIKKPHQWSSWLVWSCTEVASILPWWGPGIREGAAPPERLATCLRITFLNSQSVLKPPRGRSGPPFTAGFKAAARSRLKARLRLLSPQKSCRKPCGTKNKLNKIKNPAVLNHRASSCEDGSYRRAAEPAVMR